MHLKKLNGEEQEERISFHSYSLQTKESKQEEYDLLVEVFHSTCLEVEVPKAKLGLAKFAVAIEVSYFEIIIIIDCYFIIAELGFI